jgi:hypothetical protein
MRNKLGAKVLLVLGVLVIAAGFVVKFAVTPSLAKFPDDVDSTRTYEGTVNILNRVELENPTGEAPLFFSGLPVISDRTVQTEAVDGDGALVRDVANLLAAPGTPIAGARLTGSEDFYTIDRVTMEAIDNFTDDGRVLPREGLVVGFPIDTEARDYTGWNGDPAQTVTLFYEGPEEREGRETYKFTASSGPLPIVDEGTLSEFPAALPKEAVPALAPLLNLPPEVLGALDQALPLLPAMLPLSYTSDDPVEVYNLTYAPTEQSLADAVDDAEDYGSLLTLGRTTVPIGAWVLGAILLATGAFLLGRRPADVAVAVDESEEEA